jgi:D-alanyl-D-alanine carboxypeptidase/D-alanyl-D-alanine-endopeptidase (penicillin-binding protein 4)
MLPILLVLLLQSAPHATDANSAPRGTAAAPPHGATAPAVANPAPAVAPAVLNLRSDLDRLIKSPAWRGDQWGVLVVSLDRGDTLFAYQPDLALAPASNLKLFTSAAALYYLGPDFRYSTYLMTDGEIADGVLQGDLVIYGTGDPTLSDRFYPTKTAIWESFADSVAALGIREIRGDVVGDASYFGGPSVGLGWQESYMNAWYAAPVSALSFNENIVTLHILPGEQAGWRPKIQFIPGGEGIAIVNQATTVQGGSTSIRVDRAAYDGPIVVTGQISKGSSGVWRSVPVDDPARFAAAVLREVLESRGIRVTGEVRSIADSVASPLAGRSVFAPAFDAAPPLRVLAVHQSPPMLEILKVVNRKSHNLYAEAVLRTVGRVAVGQGTVDGGARAVRHLLERETDLDSFALRMFDGSGLSVLNRVSPRTTIALLDYMAKSPMWEDFWATLPEAGATDGLRRMYRTAAEQNLRAKTGTIDRVSALSGYVRSANGERLAFSIMSNNVPSTWRAKRVEDAIGARLAAFTRPAAVAAMMSTMSPAIASTGTGANGATPQPVPAPASAAPPGPAPSTSGPAAGAVPGAGSPSTDEAPATAEGAVGRTHVIRRGDTLDGLAKRYGTTVNAIRAKNPGINPKRLMPGDSLKLP